MNSVFKNLQITLSGYSHSPKIKGSLKGIKKGYEIDINKIEHLLIKRNPYTFYNTPRKDSAKIYFKSGIKNNKTTGKTIKFYLKNDNINSRAYTKYHFRLGHADYVSFKKFGEDYPYEGGGPFSGRITALIVIIGEICRQILEQLQEGISIYSQVKTMLDLKTDSIMNKSCKELEKLKQKYEDEKDQNNYGLSDKDKFDFLCFKKEDQINALNILKQVKNTNDSVGCEMEFKITGIKDNFGGIYLDAFESSLSYILFLIPGIKGVYFGVGKDFYKKKGSSLLEKVEVKNGRIIPLTNYAGGINGGITNGYQDIYFTIIIKPPMSIDHNMDILKYDEKCKNIKVIKSNIIGRHDIFIGNKVRFVVDGWINILILDYVLEKIKGTLTIKEGSDTKN